MRELTYAQAISEALVQALEQNDQAFIFGIGVDDWKGIFGTTEAVYNKFGKKRVFDTPASEGALTGIAIGSALNGKKPFLIHARNDFMFLTLDQMFNMAAKWKYVYAGQSTVPIVVRAIIGKGWGQGATHSQSLQSFFAHIPGLYVAMPSNPYDAKGIILKSSQVNTPVVILEHRSLYDTKSLVPQEPYTVEFGKAKVIKEGKDVTVIATSNMILEAIKAANVVEKEGISLEIIDPVSIQPLDENTIITSVEKTGRLICADSGWLRCGFASEVAATVSEKAFHSLKAPIKRITWPECPCPVSKPLEENFYPGFQEIVTTVLNNFKKLVPREIKKFQEQDTFTGPY